LRALALGLTLGLWAANSARAQIAGAMAPSDRSFLERLALARARTDLHGQVVRLTLADDLTIGDWAARNITRQRELRLWVRTRTRPRTGNARLYSDATGDVDVRVAPDDLSARLVEILGQHPPDQSRPLTADDITSAAHQWPVLWSTGSAALTEKTPAHAPLGWEDISSEGVRLARQAAIADSIHTLLEQAGRLKLTPAYRLHEFFESDQNVFKAVYEAVRDTADVLVENAPDQVAVAQAQLGMTELIRILTTVHQGHYQGDLFHAPDFREMALNTRQSRLRATGLATPPNCCRRHRPYRLTSLSTPPWVKTMVNATGRHEPADGPELTRAERIERARSDGMNLLRKKVEALIVKNDLTVERLLDDRRDLKDDVVIFLGGARVVGKPRTLPDGSLTIGVELPLERLWLIVSRGMERTEVELPDEAATTPPVQEDTP